MVPGGWFQGVSNQRKLALGLSGSRLRIWSAIAVRPSVCQVSWKYLLDF